MQNATIDCENITFKKFSSTKITYNSIQLYVICQAQSIIIYTWWYLILNVLLMAKN